MWRGEEEETETIADESYVSVKGRIWDREDSKGELCKCYVSTSEVVIKRYRKESMKDPKKWRVRHQDILIETKR